MKKALKILFFNIFPFIRASLQKSGERGFSLVGSLTFAAIGLIMAAGTVQLFVNISSQVNQLENKISLNSLKSFIGQHLNNPRACYNTLYGHQNLLWNKANGSGWFEFGDIKDASAGGSPETVASFGGPGSQIIEKEYGLSGKVAFKAECVTSPCNDCSNTAGWSGSPAICKNDWSISLISQRAVKGATVFNKPQHLARVTISFTDSTDSSQWNCNNISLGALLAASGLTCFSLTGAAEGRTSIGCSYCLVKKSGQTCVREGRAGKRSTSMLSQIGNLGDDNTFIGFHMDGRSAKGLGKANTFISDYTRASYPSTWSFKNKGNFNSFFGYSIGAFNETGDKNSFVGYQTGYSNTEGDNNSFFGFKAGAKNTKGKNNSFFGHKKGIGDTIGDSLFGAQSGFTQGRNSLFGAQIMENIRLGKTTNSLFGYRAGYSFSDSSLSGFAMLTHSGYNDNNFFGAEAGYKAVPRGHLGAGGTLFWFYENNHFFGYRAGYKAKGVWQSHFFGAEANYSGGIYANAVFGYQAGYSNTESVNTFFGNKAGYNNTKGKDNTFLGAQAGYKNTTGKNNIFIGYRAADDNSYKTLSDRFVVGNNTDVDWIVGTVNTTTLSVKGERVCLENGDGCPSPPPSSRRLKEKIKPFTNFNKALEDILKTPLFTYRYKKDSLKKDRMGIIAEELPLSLQVKEKGKLSRPDWISVYGTFWASIKALHHQFEELKEELSSRLEGLEKSFLEDLSRMRTLIKEFVTSAAQFQTQLSAGLEKAKKELGFMEKEFSEAEKELSETNRKIEDMQNNLNRMRANQKFLLKESEQRQSELASLKERIKNIKK